MGIYNNTDQDKDYTEAQAERAISHRWASAKDLSRVDDFFNNNQVFGRPLSRFLDLDAISDTVNSFKFPLNDGWNDIFDHWSRGCNSGRFNNSGFRAYPTPSARLYNKCLEKEGLSVWDDKGWWRCLFPKSALPANSQDVSREDVENDTSNKLGLFFKDYTGYLGWKTEMIKLANKKQQAEDEARLAKQRSNIQNVYDSYASSSGDLGTSNDIVSSSKSIFFKTLDNGDSEEITDISNVYRDGREERKRERKLFPSDGGSPRVEELPLNDSGSNKLTDSLIVDEGKKVGNWLWNNEKK